MKVDAEKLVEHMFEIASRALALHDAESEVAIEGDDLKAAYQNFKSINGLDRVERETPEWDRMVAATGGEYAARELAKRKAYNAKRRLKSAIERYRNA